MLHNNNLLLKKSHGTVIEVETTYFQVIASYMAFYTRIQTRAYEMATKW